MDSTPKFNGTLYIETDNEFAADLIDNWLTSYAVDIRAGLRQMGIDDIDVTVQVSDNGGILEHH